MDVPTLTRPTPNATAAATGGPGLALDPDPMVTGAQALHAALRLSEVGPGMAPNQEAHTGHAHGLLEVSGVVVREDANTLIIETCHRTK